MHDVAVICTALLGLLLFGLGLLVSLARGKYNMLGGHPADPTHGLKKLVRAHGNTAEFVPFLAIVFLYLGAQQPATWVLWMIVIGTVSRLLIVVGLLTCSTLDRPNPVRFIGALGTYVAGIALAGEMLRGAMA